MPVCAAPYLTAERSPAKTRRRHAWQRFLNHRALRWPQVGLLPVAAEGMLYCGVTAYNGDILAGFDVGTKAFSSMGYQDVAEKYDGAVPEGDSLEGRYDEMKVAQIVTFGTLQAKAAIRDVGRVLGMSFGSVR